MINIKSIKLLGVGGLFEEVTSCDNEEDVANIENIEKPTMTITVDPAITVEEGAVVNYTVTLSEPVGQPFHFFILRESSSTADGDDSDVADQSGVTFQQSVEIPAFVTTYTGSITISEDCTGEPTETLNLVFGDTRTTAVNIVPATTSITINNVLSNDLNLVLDYDQDFSIGPDAYSLCDIGYDVDFIVYNEDFSAMIEDFSAQTGACPEELTFNLDDANYPDGTYQITAYLYDTAGLEDAPFLFPFDIPITVSYDRCGSLNSSLADDGNSFVATDVFNSYTSTSGDEIYIATVVVSNGVFTIVNNDEEVVSGRPAHRNVNKIRPVGKRSIR